MSIVRIYNTKNVRRRLVGYITTTDRDFNKFPVEGKPGRVRIHPNEHLYAAFQKQIGRPWLHDFGWKILTPAEVEELIESYERKSFFYVSQANRLKTLKEML